MEVDEIQSQACNKFPDDDEVKRASTNGGGGDGRGSGVAENSSLRGWHHSSRIIRVSRASGGKDRHSKVWTSKGLRDRRVRLSVSTAIQFYDLQDRLGYDQPSKAVEWLIKAASDSISELPSLNTSFPDTPKQLSDEKKGFEMESADQVELDGDPKNYQQNPCSSTSETSKNSGLSLSRSGIRVNRVKARERARERAAKEKEKEHVNHPISHQNSSFTELLTSGIGNDNSNNHTSPSASDSHQNPNARLWPVTQMDYFTSGHHHHSSGFPGQIQVLNTMQQQMTTPPFTLSSENHQEMQQHFSFVPNPEVDYNLNFTISSSSNLAGFNRGTLQSNSPFLSHHHIQRFSSIDGSSSSSPLYIAPPQPVENHHHHHQFPAGLQLYYGDGTRNSDHKGKGKN